MISPPSDFVHIGGEIRAVPPGNDWGNSGTAYDTTTCAGGAIHAVGTNGMFDCGATNPIAGRAPLPASLTAYASAQGVTSSGFIVDPLSNQGHSDLHNQCLNSTGFSDLDPTTYTNSTKNGDPLNTYTYGPGTLTPKDDIGNIYAVFRITPSGTPEIYFGGERVINNGDSHFDFEFLQSKLTATPTVAGGCSGAFAGRRTQGDFLLSVDFPQAFGAPPALSVREWHCDNETTKKGGPVTQPAVGTVCDPGSTNLADPNWNPHYQDISGTDKAHAVSLASNAVDIPNGCGGWVCRDEMPKVFDPHFISEEETMEGGVNLASLGFNGCVQSFLPHTRSSSSFTAQLKDFGGPIAFNSCNVVTTTSVNGTPGSAGNVGSALSDSATVSGFIGAPGTVVFQLFNNVNCSGSPVFTNTATSASSGSPAIFNTTASYTANNAGTYEWVANYFDPGQPTTGSPTASSSCGSEGVTITSLDLTVSKTATPTFTRTYHWTITKDVDQTRVNIAEGGTATFNYTVGVSHDSGTDSAWQVAGTITVTNPNGVDVSGVNVSDAVDNGGVCTITGGGTGKTVPKSGGSITLAYTCTYASAPSPTSGTNTATATWPASFGSPHTSANGTATFSFTNPTTIVDGSVSVTDTQGGALGTASYTDTNPILFHYSKTQTGVAGTCTNYDNTATFTTNTTGTTGSASDEVTVCVGKDLTVAKTASTSYTRTFHWAISKLVDKTQINIAENGTATFNYTVGVTHDAGTDSAIQATGTITVSNPNDWEGIALTGVTDAVGNGGSCSITSGDPNGTVPANGSVTLSYLCTYASLPANGTNTATATWDKAAAFTPNGSASGTASVQFGAPSTIIDGSVVVTDTLGGALGTVSYTDPSPTTFTYSHTFSGDPAGTCTSHDNTATFTTSDTGTTGSGSQTVTVCVGKDLTVTKTAATTFTRTFHWGISKAVDQTKVNIAQGGTATFTYTINVTHDAGTDSNWLASGTITVSNPNDWEAITANVSDATDNGGVCTVTGGTGVSIPASGSKTLAYSCLYASAPSPADGTNTGTATWDSTAFFTPTGSASGTAAVNFDAPTSLVDESVAVNDTQGGFLGTVSYTDPSPTTFTYQKTQAGVAGTCTNYDNTATFTTNDSGTTGSASQTVTVCVGKDLTVSKTATPAFTRTYLWSILKLVDGKSSESFSGFTGTTVTANYSIAVNETGVQDSAWATTGKITISNPNDWEAITANVSDAVDNGGACTVSGGSNVSIPASSSVQLNYSCSWGSAPSAASGTNTATATWDKGAFFTPSGSASGTATFAFATPTNTVNKTITVTDTYAGTLGTLTATDSTPFTSHTYTYSRTFTLPNGCTTVNNTATITETGQSSSASVQLCGVLPPAAQITPTNTTCAAFAGGTSATLDDIFYTGSNGVIQQNVNPGVFFYWVRLTSVPSGSQSYTVLQNNDGNGSVYFTVASGSGVFDSNCNAVSGANVSAGSNGSVNVTFSSASGGTFYIGIKYNAKAVAGTAVPTTTCNDAPADGNVANCADYVFSTNNNSGSQPNPVPSTTQEIDLAPSGSTVP